MVEKSHLQAVLVESELASNTVHIEMKANDDFIRSGGWPIETSQHEFPDKKACSNWNRFLSARWQFRGKIDESMRAHLQGFGHYLEANGKTTPNQSKADYCLMQWQAEEEEFADFPDYVKAVQLRLQRYEIDIPLTLCPNPEEQTFVTDQLEYLAFQVRQFEGRTPSPDEKA